MAYPGDLPTAGATSPTPLRAAPLRCSGKARRLRLECRLAVANIAVRHGLRALCGPLAHAVLRPAERTTVGDRDHRHQRQDDDQPVARSRASALLRGDRYARRGFSAIWTIPADDAEATNLARYLTDFANAGAQACASRPVRSASRRAARRHARRRRGLHQSDARSSRLPRFDGSYAEAKKRLFAWPRLRLAVVNLDDPFGRRAGENDHGDESVGIHARRRLCRPARRGSRRRRGRGGDRLALPPLRTERQGAVGNCSGRPLQRSNLLAVAAVLLDAGLCRPRSRHACRTDAAAGAPGKDRWLQRAADRRRLRAYAGRPRKCACGAAWRGDCARRKARGRVWLRWRPRSRQAPADGRDRHAPRRPRRADQRQPAQRIIDDIRIGVPRAEVIADRKLAIAAAIASAAPADVVLLAGKGHEASQEIAGTFHPFSDLQEATAALAARKGAA
jgi:hypothetical protein